VHSAPVARGVMVVDAGLRVVASNPEVLQILAFPERPEQISNLDIWLANKVRSKLADRQSPSGIASEVQSARRTYLCRSFPLEPVENHKDNLAQSGRLLILMIERKSNEAATIVEVSERFGLTRREQETVQFLLEGFTSKEIAQRMNISANTVKAFIRLVMAKMDVSTRSGIVGKVACGDSKFGRLRSRSPAGLSVQAIRPESRYGFPGCRLEI
jgi:DNA-binding CsgD family transcriptional regulator